MPLLNSEELEQLSPVFRGRTGRAFAHMLIRVLSVDRLNDLYDRNCHLRGPDFASALLDDIGLKHELVPDIETLQDVLPEGPFITISNHPCGHVDGISLVDIFGHLRPDYKVMVNRILGRIRAMDGNFIQVTPTGAVRTAPTADSVSGMKEALRHLRDGGALGLFPAGAVSDLSLADRAVRDRPWQEPVIKLIARSGVPVLPVRFFGRNSFFYYSLGLIDWKIRILRLPAEVFNKKGKPFLVGTGPLIMPDQYSHLRDDIPALSSFLRAAVYDMKF